MLHTDEKNSARSSNSAAGSTDPAIVLETSDNGEAFSVSHSALVGHALKRSNPADGAVVFCAARWGVGRSQPDLAAAAQFLAQMEGAP